MPDDTQDLSSGKPSLDELLAEVVAAEEAGRPLDGEALAAKHPHFAADLREFVANRNRMQQLAAPLREAAPRGGTSNGPARGTIRYFGDYELQGEIAAGGMGIVYKARQVSLNRIVAVKMILKGTLATEDDVKRFRAEAEAAANLQHPGIVAIHEVGLYEGQHYFSMDYVDGLSLASLPRETPLSARQAAEYVREASLAVHAAHQQGTLHRDLKPSNILIDRQGRVRITDFGLAKRITGNSDLTLTGQILGTPSYMPPEQALGKRSLIGTASDVYSLGAVLYELLTGRPPFRGESPAETLRQVETLDPISPRLLSPATPRDLETICLKCLDKEPHKRYSTAQHLAEDLGRFLRGEPIHARPISRPGRAWRWCRRNPVVASLAATTSLALTTAIAVLIASNIRVQGALADRTRALASLGVQQKETKSALVAKSKAVQELDDSNQKLRASLEKEKGFQLELTRANQSLRQSIGREQGATYARGMNLAYQYLAANDLAQANAILDSSGTDELHDWEWRYLKSQCNPVGIFSTRGYVGQGAVAPISRDGRLAFFPDDGTIRLVDLTSGAQSAILRGHGGLLSALVFSPDGTRLAAAGQHWDGSQRVYRSQVSVWDTKDRRQICVAPMGASSLAFSPDGRRLAVGFAGGSPQQWRVTILDPDSGRPIMELPRGKGMLHDIAFSPDGGSLAIAGHGVWSLETRERSEPDSPPTGDVHSVAYSSDGKLLAMGTGGGMVAIWDIARKSVIRSIPAHGEFVHSLSFHPNSRWLASASNDRSVKVWDAGSGTELYSVRHANLGFCAAAFSPDGEYLLTATWGSGQFNSFGFASMSRGKGVTPGEIRLWHAASGPASHVLAGHSRGAWGVVLSSDGLHLASAGEDKTVILWDPATGKKRLALVGHTDFVCGVAFSPDDTVLASAGRDKTVRLWQVADGRELSAFPLDAEAYSVAFSTDGTLLAATDAKGQVSLWDWKTGPEPRTWSAHQGKATTIAFHRDGRRLVTGGEDKAVRLWDVSSQQQIGADLVHPGIVFHLALTRDGKRLGVVGTNGQMPCGFGFINTAEGNLQLHRERRDGFVRLWDLATNHAAVPITDQPHPVYSVGFSIDDKRMVVASGRGLRFWDVALGQELLTLPISGGLTRGMAFHPDGNTIAVSDAHGQVTLLDGSLHQLEAERDLAFRRRDEGRLLLDAGNLPAALQALEEAQSLRQKVAQADPNPRNETELADAYQDLEAFYLQVRRSELAAAAGKKSLEIREALAARHGQSQLVVEEFAAALLAAARNAQPGPGAAEGEQRCRRGIELLQRLAAADPDLSPAALELAAAHAELGRLLKRIRPADAPAAFEQAIAVLTPLAKAHPSLVGLHMELMLLHDEWAATLEPAGKLNEAVQLRSRALEVAQHLAEQFPWASTYRHQQARHAIVLAQLLLKTAAVAEAEERFAAGRSILEQLARDEPEIPAYQQELARHYMSQATRYKSADQPAEAEANYLKALPLYEQLAESGKSSDSRQEYGVALNELGIFYFREERFDEAQPLYEKTLQLREKLASANQRDPMFAVQLAGSYCNMGHLHMLGRKDPQASMTWYDKSIAALAPLVQRNAASTATNYLFNAYQGRGEANFRRERFAEAAVDFSAALDLGIIRERVHLRCRVALARACAGDHAQAAADAKTLLSEKPGSAYLVDLAEVWSQAATAAQGDPPLAQSYIEQALAALRGALSSGWKDKQRLETSTHLSEVRQRPEFQPILEEIDK